MRSERKRADITPLFKKQLPFGLSNFYRVSKLAKEKVKCRSMDLWGEANVLNPKQFEYMKKGRSAVTQLLSCLND